VLSIDFDYFIDASSKEREMYFHNVNDEMDSNKVQAFWKASYLQHPELKKVGVIEDFYYVLNRLRKMDIPVGNMLKADSHKSIMDLIDSIPKSQQLMIVNIDFHHDYYHYYTGNDKVNCGNWLRRVVEERPDTKVQWIRREDSQLYSLDGKFPFEHTEDIKVIHNKNFDYVFICSSPEWSPPHLKDKFHQLSAALSKNYQYIRLTKWKIGMQTTM
jgi:hypothetical protein